MMIGKRHLVLAGLLIALGAAVYLNWQFAPADSVSPTAADGVVQADEYGYVTISAETVSSSQASAPDAEDKAVDVAKPQNVFEQARSDRETTRKEAMETLDDIIADPALEKSQKTTAVESAARMTEEMEAEAAIELLIKAKGFSDCVVVIGETQVNVIIPAPEGGLKSSDAAIIRDIVVGQREILPSMIKIIEAK